MTWTEAEFEASAARIEKLRAQARTHRENAEIYRSRAAFFDRMVRIWVVLIALEVALIVLAIITGWWPLGLVPAVITAGGIFYNVRGQGRLPEPRHV